MISRIIIIIRRRRNVSIATTKRNDKNGIWKSSLQLNVLDKFDIQRTVHRDIFL